MEQTETERAWSEALAREHAHQRELLAAFRGELGEFARECAAALDSLDSFVDGLGGVVSAIELARDTHGRATLLDVARRFPGLSTAQQDDLYVALGEDGDLQPRIVEEARALLAQPGRSDGELLKAIVDSSGIRSAIERLVGPAPLAAAEAVQALSKRVPGLWTLEQGEDRSAETLFEALESAGEAAGVAGVAEARALAGALREAREHAEHAARAVEDGALDDVVAQARIALQEDLAALASVLDRGEPSAWRAERELELEELRHEVRQKLEYIERTRRLLLALLPRLRVIARALGLAEKLYEAEGRLDTSTPAIARMSLASGLGALGTPTPSHRIARPRSRSRLLVAALAVLAALIGAAAALLATRGGTEAIAEAPVQPPTVAAIEAVFRDADRATYYSVAVSPDEKVRYAWSLRPPVGDPGCTKLSQIPGKANEAIWRHGGTDGCRHVTTEHLGTVTVTITTPISTCTARFVGSETRTSPDEPRCRPS